MALNRVGFVIRSMSDAFHRRVVADRVADGWAVGGMRAGRVGSRCGRSRRLALRGRFSSSGSSPGRNFLFGRWCMDEAPSVSREKPEFASLVPETADDQRVAGGGPLPTGGR